MDAISWTGCCESPGGDEETFLECLLHANIPPEVVDVAWLTTLDRLWIGVELSMILSLGLVVVNLPVAC